jgi:hypothetical protein
MIRTVNRQKLNLLAARVGLTIRDRAHEGTTTLTFTAGDMPLAAVVGLHEASVWLHGYVSAVVQVDTSFRRDAPEWLALMS